MFDYWIKFVIKVGFKFTKFAINKFGFLWKIYGANFNLILLIYCITKSMQSKDKYQLPKDSLIHFLVSDTISYTIIKLDFFLLLLLRIKFYRKSRRIIQKLRNIYIRIWPISSTFKKSSILTRIFTRHTLLRTNSIVIIKNFALWIQSLYVWNIVMGYFNILFYYYLVIVSMVINLMPKR